MDDLKLEQLLADLESDRVERKAALFDQDRVREAICAFANDLPGHEHPGVLIVGARDDGTCAGLTVTDELEKNGSPEPEFEVDATHVRVTVRKRA